MLGPQFSRYPSSSLPRGPRGVGGGVGTGVGGGGGGVGGVGGLGGGTGVGGVGGGTGVSGHSESPEHDFVQSVVQRPPLPPLGYSPQVVASPHLLQQHFLLDGPGEGLGLGTGLGGLGTGLGAGVGSGVGRPWQSESPEQGLE